MKEFFPKHKANMEISAPPGEPRRTRSQFPLWVISGQTSSTPKSNLVRYSGVCIIANLFPISQTVLNKLRERNYV